MKLFKWIWENILFILTLFLLAFIPLYPKRPLLDIVNTWVYIRIEDFVVAFIILLWVLLLLFKKVNLKTPLTMPIMLFWIIGGIATLHGVLLIFPTIANVFSNVAFLSMLRRIEYMSLFFIAFFAIKDKKHIYHVIAILTITLLLVVGYGIGQKFFGFPAFLTMNEEFAKGAPIKLSYLSRVSSTFAGHYDLAAYLVLIVPLLTSMAFGFRNLLIKIFLLASSALGFGLLFLTVSRVSFFVLLFSMAILLVLQKKTWVFISLFLITVGFLFFSPSLTDRFKNTITEIDVIVDAKTGESLGHVKEVPASYFKNKIVKRQQVDEEANSASSSAILPFSSIPEIANLVIESNAPTGENLPQGTSYINLPLSPIIKKTNHFFNQKSSEGGKSEEIGVFFGEYLIKRAKAYDLSFTTRFQGEWPRTLNAFKRNIFLGSGYGSVSLAVDNNYLRILGESGLFGLGAFLSIFIIAFIYIKKILPQVDSPIVKSFVLGFIAGASGLMLNGLLIDVFEASKIAFVFWLLMGVTLGVLKLYKMEETELFTEFKKVIFSTYAIIIYLLTFTTVLFFSVFNYYFVGDDFTWFRWVSQGNIFSYFTQANGFFYRPGTKMYFSAMYSAFWLNQTMYHLVSIILHFLVATLIFLIAKRVLKNYFLSVISAILFLILSGYHEAIFWISATGFLFSTIFTLFGLLLFIYWKEKNKKIYFIFSLISIVFSMLFHELGIISPLLIILYDTVLGERLVQNKLFQKTQYLILLFPILPYLFLRIIAHSHWFNGDYSYNLLKLPYNFIGNLIGYFLLTFAGPITIPIYQGIRIATREHIVIGILGSIMFIFVCVFFYRKFIQKMALPERKIIIFALLFFVIALLPFLGLGNITSRYSYLSSFGAILIFIIFLKKTYEYFLSEGKYVTIGIIIMIAIVFSFLHLIQLQKIHTDWNAAGEKSKSFIVSLNRLYLDDWTKNNMQFYFIDVPIRVGEAWVFPVGLRDAVWFIFKNEHIGINQVQSVEEAYKLIGTATNGKVFVFRSDGGLIEMMKTERGEIVPTKR